MPTFRRIAGSWVKIPRIFRRVGGVFRPIYAVHRRVAGVWRVVFHAYEAFNPPATVVAGGQPNVNFTLNMRNNGTWQMAVNSAFYDTGDFTAYRYGGSANITEVCANTYCVVSVEFLDGRCSVTNNLGGVFLTAASPSITLSASFYTVVRLTVKLYGRGAEPALTTKVITVYLESTN